MNTSKTQSLFTLEQVQQMLAMGVLTISTDQETPKAEVTTTTTVEADGYRPKTQQEFNSALADWMRSVGVQPRGRAWRLAKEGERRVKKLRQAAEKDGIDPYVEPKPAKKSGRKAKAKAKATTKKAADVNIAAPAKEPKRTEPWQDRNGRWHYPEGQFMSKVEAASLGLFHEGISADEADVLRLEQEIATTDEKVDFYVRMAEAGFKKAKIDAAWTALHG